MTTLEKELMEALESIVSRWDSGRELTAEHYEKARAALARAKQTGHHEFTVTDDGHGRAMVRASKLRDGGLRLAFGGMGVCVGDYFVGAGEKRSQVNVGTRVRVELRDGVDYATLVEVLS